MSVHAGDSAIFRMKGGREVVVLVHGLTAKRVRIVLNLGAGYVVRYVKREHLEKVPGGGLVECR